MSPSDKPSSLVVVLGFLHRWLRRFATAVLLVIVLGAAAAVLVWSTGSEFTAARATAFLNARVLGAETRLTVDDVKGSPFRRLVLTGVHLSRTGPEGSYDFLSAREVELTYDLWGLLHGRYAVSRATARGLALDFRTEGKTLLLPTFRGGGGKKGSPAPSFRIRKLLALDGEARVELPWRTLELDSLSAELSVESDRDGLTIEVGKLHGVAAESLGTLDLEDGALAIGSEISLQDLRGTWSGSPFAVSGTVAKAPVALSVRIEQFPLERLGRFLDEKGLESGFVDRALGAVRTADGRVLFEVDGAARWDPWTADSLSGRGEIEDGILHLRDVTASIEGASFRQVEVDLPLHELPFTARGRADNFDMSILRIPVFDYFPGVLGGRAELRFGDRKNLNRALDLRVWAEAGIIREVPFHSGAVTGSGRDGVFRFDTLRVEMEGARAWATGTTAADFLDLNIAYEGRVEPLRRLLRREDAAGEARLGARLNGPTRSPLLIGGGTIADLEVADVRAPLVTLVEAEGPLVEGQDLRIHAVADRGITVGALAFDRGESRFSIAPDSVLVSAVTLARGDTLVEATGSFRWEPSIVVEVATASAEADGRRFRSRAPFRLHLDGETVSSPGLIVDTARGSLVLAGSWDFATRNYSVEAEAYDLDPSVLFPPESPPAVAVGKVNGVLDLAGTGDALSGSARLGLREIDWKGGHLDTAFVEGAVDGGNLRFDRLMARLGSGRVDVVGTVALPVPVTAAARGLRRREYPDPERTSFGLGAEVSRLDLGEWKFLLPPTQRVGGRVQGRARLEGTSARPVLRVDGVVHSLAWKGLEADSVRAAAGYAEGAVELETLRLWEEGQSAEASGSFPLELAFLPFSASVPERPMRLRVESRDGSLRGLELTPWIKKAEGSLRAQLDVGGTPRRPVVEGGARVDGGRVELRERDEVVEDISARFTFAGDVVRVEDARGILTVGWAGTDTPGGIATASGTYRLAAREAQSYRLELSVADGLVGEEGVYAGRVSGNLVLEPRRAPDGRIYPTATGSLNVHRLEYAGSLKPQDIGELAPPSLLYEVSIEAPEKIMVRTDQAQAELGGELSVRRTVDKQVILGTLDILSGSYQFFQKTFRVTDGRLLWESPDTRIPNLDIQAETKEAGYRILVDLQGRADQPEITLRAESLDEDSARELTPDEIIQLLALGAVGLASTGQNGAGSEVTARPGEAAAGWGILGAEQLFGSEIEKQLAEQIGISADVQVETESSRGDFEPRVGIRTYVGELSFQYLQGLSRTYEQDVAVEYRLRRLIVLRGSVINLPLESKQEYNLDLKLRQEY